MGCFESMPEEESERGCMYNLWSWSEAAFFVCLCFAKVERGVAICFAFKGF